MVPPTKTPKKPTAEKVSPSTSVSIGEQRLHSQQIASTNRWGTLQEVAKGMLAQQGQDLASVKWSLGLRVAGSTEQDVDELFNRGEIVRSWPMRGTLHLTAAADLPWMLDLLSERIVKATTARRAALNLDEKSLEQARKIVIKTLEKNKSMSREALLQAIESQGVSTAQQRGYHILFNLSLTKTLCLGPVKDGDQHFVLLDEWVKKPKRLSVDESLKELAVRYFTSHGPATLPDFIGWAKLTAKEAKLAVSLANKEIQATPYAAKTYYQTAISPSEHSSPNAPFAAVLPGFDEFVLGYKDRSEVLAPDYADEIVPGGNGVFRPTLVWNGKLCGTWTRTKKGKVTVIDVKPFEPLSKQQQKLFEHEFKKYEQFVGATIQTSFHAKGL